MAIASASGPSTLARLAWAFRVVVAVSASLLKWVVGDSLQLTQSPGQTQPQQTQPQQSQPQHAQLQHAQTQPQQPQIQLQNAQEQPERTMAAWWARIEQAVDSGPNTVSNAPVASVSAVAPATSTLPTATSTLPTAGTHAARTAVATVSAGTHTSKPFFSAAPRAWHPPPPVLPHSCAAGQTWKGSRFSASVSDGLAGRAYVPVWCSGADTPSNEVGQPAPVASGGTWSQFYKRPSDGWAPFNDPSSKAPAAPSAVGSAFYSPFAVCDEI